MFTDFEKLKDALARLEPPGVGKVRVYRGQTTDYARMLPSGLRGKPLRSEGVFDAYTNVLADQLLNSAPGYATDPTRIATFLIWTRAITQHYGPGSSFLDVTRSLEVALWFALHKVTAIPSHHVFGRPGPIDASTDMVADAETQVITRAASGFLYVLDVPRIAVAGFLDHGTLIDLAESPAVFAESPRIQAQNACLIHADSRLTDPDLSFLLVCRPIAVGLPMDGCDYIIEPVSTVFPTVNDDEWYDRLTCVPWTNRLSVDHGTVAIAPAVPVNLFAEGTIDEGLLSRLIVVPPHNVRKSVLEEIAWCSDPPHPLLKKCGLADATRILLEAPVLSTTPSIESGAWNEGLLVEGVPASVDVRINGSESRVDLTNVFVEFSPLERVGWEKVERGEPMTALVRGLWLVRDDDDGYVMSLFLQNLPEGIIAGFGGIEVRYEQRANRLMFKEWDRNDSNVQYMFLKRLITTLFLLRGMTSKAHVNPFASFLPVGATTDAPAVIPWFAAGETTLVAARSAYDGDQVFVPRMTQTGNEYFTPFSRDGEVTVLVPSSGFCDVDPDVVLRSTPMPVASS